MSTAFCPEDLTKVTKLKFELKTEENKKHTHSRSQVRAFLYRIITLSRPSEGFLQVIKLQKGIPEAIAPFKGAFHCSLQILLAKSTAIRVHVVILGHLFVPNKAFGLLRQICPINFVFALQNRLGLAVNQLEVGPKPINQQPSPSLGLGHLELFTSGLTFRFVALEICDVPELDDVANAEQVDDALKCCYVW
jgi:hypothetical protein